MERGNTIKTKIARTGSALALLIAATVTVVTPAAARPWGWHHHGWGLGAGFAAGVIGGAFAAATSPYWAPGYYDYDYPDYGYRTYAYVPGTGSGVAYCEAHFRSYNPETGTYLGYDGQYHHCP